MRALVLLLVLTACYDDHYRCTIDAQCDLGAGGRCELDGHCTVLDPTCPTERAYAEHSGQYTGACYDFRIAPENPCIGGQPPATALGCLSEVCVVLPACCKVGWSDACVQIAEQLCPFR
jgi:hypothetical protein